MQGVRKIARSGSLKLEEWRGKERKYEAEKEPAELLYEKGFTGSEVAMDGLLMLEELLKEITCSGCGQIIQGQTIQCRKGHIYCRACRKENSCRICKQTFVDSPNLALERILSLIALPCKYRDRGCVDSLVVSQRQYHEATCQYRPVACQFQHHGCSQVFSLKDMFWHNKMCIYAHHPHANVLPNMPINSKSKSLVNGEA